MLFATPFELHHSVLRLDETWQPEWSGKPGGVQRRAVRSRGCLGASQSFGLRRQASWLKVWRGGGWILTRRNEHASGTEAGWLRNAGGKVCSRQGPRIKNVPMVFNCLMENPLDFRSPREPSPSDKQAVRELFYAMPMMERGKPVVAELTWVLLGRPNPDEHEKLLPDYCYNIFDVAQKTVFKAFPLLSDTLLVMDKAGAETAKTIEAAKKTIRLDWRNLGRLTGLAVRCIRFAELEAQDHLKVDGFDEMPLDEVKEKLTLICGRQWVEENQANILAETPDVIFSRMLKEFMAGWIEKVNALQPKFDALAYQWSPAAMAEFNAGMAEGTSSFLDAAGQLAGESLRMGTYTFLLLAWPEIKGMQTSLPRKTITDLQEWMLPFMRAGLVTYLEVDELRVICAPPSQSGIGLSLRPLKSRRAASSA